MAVKKDIAEQLAQRCGLSLPTARQTIDTIFTVIREAVLDEVDPVVIRGFGTFHPVERKARTARNPQTGEPVAVPPKKLVRFRPSKALVHELGGDTE